MFTERSKLSGFQEIDFLIIPVPIPPHPYHIPHAKEFNERNRLWAHIYESKRYGLNIQFEPICNVKNCQAEEGAIIVAKGAFSTILFKIQNMSTYPNVSVQWPVFPSTHGSVSITFSLFNFYHLFIFISEASI